MVSTRASFTLIELIFSILIISIAVISLPLMSQISSKTIEDSFAQEAIFIASQKLNLALSYHWDDNSLSSGDTLTSVIDVVFDCNTSTMLRPGHILQPKHRKCNTNTSIDATILQNYSLNDTVDITPVEEINSTSAHGYKNTYNSQTSVTNSESGVKKISVAITSSDGKAITTLSSFASNIGEIDYHHRAY